MSILSKDLAIEANRDTFREKKFCAVRNITQLYIYI